MSQPVLIKSAESYLAAEGTRVHAKVPKSLEDPKDLAHFFWVVGMIY